MLCDRKAHKGRRERSGAETWEEGDAGRVIMNPLPLAELVKAIAELQQTQHQALLQVRAEQEQWFWGAKKDPASPPSCPPPCIPLTKMGAQDDVEAFLELFEHKAAAGEWTGMETDRILVFNHQLRDACRRWLLDEDRSMNEVVDRVALKQFITRLPPAGNWDISWTSVPSWIWRWTPKRHRLPLIKQELTKMGAQDDVEAFLELFEHKAAAGRWTGMERALRLLSLLSGEAQLATQQLPADRILGFNHQLRDACRRWLLDEDRSMDEVVDRVALKQFITRLPPAGNRDISWTSVPSWIWRWTPKRHRLPDQAGTYRIPVSIQGGTHQALVDSGCKQTPIHQSLVRYKVLDAARRVK
ncbi:hypothetical protein C0J50_7558, partial [Silurus asotus]